MARMAVAKSSRATAAPASSLAAPIASASAHSSACAVELRIGRADIFARVTLLLDTDDVGRPLVASEQILAVLGVEEGAQRLDPANDQHQIVLAFEREHRIDQVVPRALLAQLDLEPVGEEGKQVGRHSVTVDQNASRSCCEQAILDDRLDKRKHPQPGCRSQ